MFDRTGTNLWTYEEPLQFKGVEIGRIMSVMGLSSGGLFVQSPAELTPELETTLDDLGEVRFVAPASKLHGHLYMEQYRAAYPDAELSLRPASTVGATILPSTTSSATRPIPAGHPISTRS